MVTSYANTASITIPAAGSAGPADPYPSVINVAGVPGAITQVTVTLNNMNHTFPDDIDILLVGPFGQSVILMSDAGGSLDINNVTLTFDDFALSQLPDGGPIVSGTFQPSNFGGDDTFPAPAPPPLYGSALSVFNGTNPNGAWRLFVVDDVAIDVGSIAGGWSLDMTVCF